MIATLYNYFGVVGLASIALWLAAWALGLAYAVRWRRMAIGRAVLILAVLALILARVNSTAVGRIGVDPTKTAAPKAEDPARTKAVEALRKRAAGVRFAEDSKTDALDLGGAGSSELHAVTGHIATPPSDDYHSRGKQRREVGKSGEASAPPEDERRAGELDASVRYLPEADVIRANRWDDINLNVVQLTLWAAIGLVVFDYFRRFNRAFEPVMPLPLAGPVIDAVIPKSRVVYLREAGEGDEAIRRLLERAVRKGETFIYLGPKDPWPQQPWLTRWKVWRWARRIDKLTCGSADGGVSREFAFEAAWFNRACVTATDSTMAGSLPDHVVDALAERRAGGAARRTVNLVSHAATPPGREMLDKLVPLCCANNFRLVVVTPEVPPADTVHLFDEIRGD